MNRFAMEGGHLTRLVRGAAALCRVAQRSVPRVVAGRPPTFASWQIGVLILVAVIHRRKSKCAQYRFLEGHRDHLLRHLQSVLHLQLLPSRATYMRRYPDAHRLFAKAIDLGGRRALRAGVGDQSVVAVDKSMIAARGRVGCGRVGRQGRRRRGVDAEAGWGRSAHDGWVFGYSYEVVVCVGKRGNIVPLLASADAANRSEHRSFAEKIPRLPPGVGQVLADAGYDGSDLDHAIAYDSHGRRTRRRLVCPLIARGGMPAVGHQRRKGRRERCRQLRIRRAAFLNSTRGRRLYARRKETVEPFNAWLKHLFELEDRVWHRGLDNNRTMILAAIFAYQQLQHLNHRLGNPDGCVQWILDTL